MGADLSTRILLATSDGHDRGVRDVACALRDAGLEVVWGGTYQSPGDIVWQAIQEDPDIIGISTLSGDHAYLFENIMLLLREAQARMVVVGGGIIPQEDRPALMAQGVSALFDPGADRDKDIVPELRRLAMDARKRKPMHAAVKKYWEALCGGEDRGLARIITYVLRNDTKVLQCIDDFRKAHTSRAHAIGVSGSGGVGKSSLLARLVGYAQEWKVGVLFVDPPALSGGAFLGDRIRLQSLRAPIPRHVYARSIAAHRPWRGVTEGTPHILDAMRAAGKEVIFVESTGVGQQDVGFSGLVDTHVYVCTPSYGDWVQVMKGGALETAHIIVLNQCDKKGAEEVFANLMKYWGRRDIGGWRVPLLKTNAVTGEGVGELWQAIRDHGKLLNRITGEGR